MLNRDYKMAQEKFKIVSKTEQVLNYITKMIESGDLAPGDQLLPEQQLCTKLSVSMITIRRGLKELVNRGLIYKVRGKGNFVSEHIESGKINDVDYNTVNLLYPETHSDESSNVFLGPLIKGLNTKLGSKSLRLRMVPVSEGNSLTSMLNDKANRNMLSSGIILVNYNPTSRDKIALQTFGAPTVIIGRPGNNEITTVGIDQYNSGRAIAEHFVVLHGFKKVLYITRLIKDRPHLQDILAGIKAVYKEEEIDFDDSFSRIEIEENLSPAEITRILDENLNAITDSEMVFFQGDELGLPLINLLNKRNIKVPDDVALIAHDNFSIIAEYSSPSITAIVFSPLALGKHAAATFIKILNGGKIINKEELALKSELIIRESCGCGKLTSYAFGAKSPTETSNRYETAEVS